LSAVAFASSRKAADAAAPLRSMLMARTSKSGPPSFDCSSASAGISLRQGAHQVAQRLTRVTLPRQSDSLSGLPSPSAKARSATAGRCGLTTKAASGPVAMARVIGPGAPAVAVAGGAGLLPDVRIGYIA
jgi:hypothetical protein